MDKTKKRQYLQKKLYTGQGGPIVNPGILLEKGKGKFNIPSEKLKNLIPFTKPIVPAKRNILERLIDKAKNFVSKQLSPIANSAPNKTKGLDLTKRQ